MSVVVALLGEALVAVGAPEGRLLGVRAQVHLQLGVESKALVAQVARKGARLPGRLLLLTHVTATTQLLLRLVERRWQCRSGTNACRKWSAREANAPPHGPHRVALVTVTRCKGFTGGVPTENSSCLVKG